MTHTVEDFIPAVARFISANAADSAFQLTGDSTFEEIAASLFAFQFERVKPYRQLCEYRRITPANLGDWSRIPAVPAHAFKEFELTSIPSDQRSRVFHSSGTTKDRPGRHFHDTGSIGLYEESLWRGFDRHMLSAATPEFKCVGLTPLCVALTPSGDGAPQSSLVHMFDTVRRRFEWRDFQFCGAVDDAGAWRLEASRCRDALQESLDLNHPLMILGTAFNLVHLIDHLMANEVRYQLPAGSRIMETGGYKGRSREIPRTELHRQITECLGVPPSHIVCEYSMSEISSQAYDHVAGQTSPRSRTFRFPPWARVRIVSPESGREVSVGEIGLIQIFDLANVRSVMAIQTDDLGLRRADGFELIGRAGTAEPRGCSRMSN